VYSKSIYIRLAIFFIVTICQLPVKAQDSTQSESMVTVSNDNLISVSKLKCSGLNIDVSNKPTSLYLSKLSYSDNRSVDSFIIYDSLISKLFINQERVMRVFSTRTKCDKSAIPQHNLPWIIESVKAFDKYDSDPCFRQTFNPGFIK